jgi:hypothetical protein
LAIVIWRLRLEIGDVESGTSGSAIAIDSLRNGQTSIAVCEGTEPSAIDVEGQKILENIEKIDRTGAAE